MNGSSVSLNAGGRYIASILMLGRCIQQRAGKMTRSQSPTERAQQVFRVLVAEIERAGRPAGS
jgi:hypothetical protein